MQSRAVRKGLAGFVEAYLESGATQYGGMLAFSLFVSLIPLVLGILSIFGLVVHPRRGGVLGSMLVDSFPPDLHAPVRQAIAAAGPHAGLVFILSLVSLAWFCTGLFSTTGFALNQINRWPHRRFWEQRLLGLWLAPALVVAVAAVVAFGIALRLAGLPGWLALFAAVVALTAIIAFLYSRAPSRRPPRLHVFPGAALAATIIVLAGLGLTETTNLTFHLAVDTQFFAQVFALATWVYLIAQSILLGAVLNRSLQQALA